MNGPPERRSPATQDRAPSTTPLAAAHLTAREAACLWRRGRALLECGHRADPHRSCWRCSEINERQAEAAAEAIEHLDAHGLPALANAKTCRGLARIGRRDLAVSVHRRTSGEGV